jgi:hypothetical protein
MKIVSSMSVVGKQQCTEIGNKNAQLFQRYISLV